MLGRRGRGGAMAARAPGPGAEAARGGGAPAGPRTAAWRWDLGRLLRMWAAVKVAQAGVGGGAALLEEAGRAPWDPPRWLLEEAENAAPLADWGRSRLLELALAVARPNGGANIWPKQLEPKGNPSLLDLGPWTRKDRGLRNGKMKGDWRNLKRAKSTGVRLEKSVRPVREALRVAERGEGAGQQPPGASTALSLGERCSLAPGEFRGLGSASQPPRFSRGRVWEVGDGHCCPPVRSYSLPCPVCSKEEDLLFDYGDASRSLVVGSRPGEVTEGLGPDRPGLVPALPLDLVGGGSGECSPGYSTVSSSSAATPLRLNELPGLQGAPCNFDARYLDARCDSATLLLDNTAALLLPGRPPGTRSPAIMCPEDRGPTSYNF